MRSAASIILSALCVFLFACSTMQTGNDFAAGRRALIVGDDQAALRFFQSAAESNPQLYIRHRQFSEAKYLELRRSRPVFE